MLTELKEDNEPTPKIFALRGVWEFTKFVSLLEEHSVDQADALPFIDDLAVQISQAGLSVGVVQYHFNVDTLAVKHASGVVRLSVSLPHAVPSATMPSKEFHFPLVEVDGVIKLQIKEHTTRYDDAPVLAGWRNYNHPVDSDESHAEQKPRQTLRAAFTDQDEVPSAPQMELRPLTGWLKEVVEQTGFTMDELNTLVETATDGSLAYTNFMRLLIQELAGEVHVMDSEHRAFTIVVNNSETKQYDSLSIIYRSQRLNAIQNKNVMQINADLVWGDDHPDPVLTYGENTSFRSIEYSGDLMQHAALALQFDFQRIAASQPTEMPLVDKLAALFNNPIVAEDVCHQLMEKGLNDVVDRVTFKLADNESLNQSLPVRQVQLTFFNKGVVEVASMMTFWEYNETLNEYVAPRQSSEIKLADKIAKVVKADTEERTGHRHSIGLDQLDPTCTAADMEHFRLKGVEMRTIPDHPAQQNHAMKEPVTPTLMVGNIDLRMTFKDRSLPRAMLKSFTHYGDVMVKKYEELFVLLTGSCVGSDMPGMFEEYTLCVFGIVSEGAHVQPKVTITLSVRHEYETGNWFKGEVRYKFD